MPAKLFIRVGTRFGAWVVSSDQTKKSGHHTLVHVRCKCGYTTFKRNSDLKPGMNGCAKCSHTKYNVPIPYKDTRRLLGRISQIINRCNKRSHTDYHDYGGRGITVFDEWVSDREQFLRYLITLKGWNEPELMIDRIENNGNYEPGNIRFTDVVTSARNRRKRKPRNVNG